MSRDEFAEMISKCAKDYKRADPMKSLLRNFHMHAYRGSEIDPDLANALIVDFANFICFQRGINLALYACDLLPEKEEMEARESANSGKE